MKDVRELLSTELTRYARHFNLPEFGLEGQKRLKAGSALVVGAGGLGSPLLLYLAAAGVGRIGIVDFDRVDESNLQRQVLYDTADLGMLKTEAARERLSRLNPHVRIDVYTEAITRENALDIIADYDVVADGADNFPTRYLVNDACVLAGKVNVYGAIFRFEGQVSVFNYPDGTGGRGPNYRDLFPTPPPPELAPNCAEGGVLGVLPGIIGSMQASEVIKVLAGVGRPLAGRLFLFDAAEFSSRILNIPKNPELVIRELIDYEQFCGTPAPDAGAPAIKSVSAEELRAWKAAGIALQIIDVREAYEYEVEHMGGELIPLSEVEANVQRIAHDRKVVVHCRGGQRSAAAIRRLQDRFGFDNLYNLEGGILAWSRLQTTEEV
jgi:molybdopterin/thiamine biosynthesis adenylyltransferase/rhodanese-related sulfurtransferase